MEKRLVVTLGATICLALSVGCQAPQGPAGLSEADRTAIRQNGENYARLVNAKDREGAAAVFADDAMVLLPNAAAVQGRAAYQASMDFSLPFNFQLQSLEIEGRGDLAYERGTYSMTVTPVGAAHIEDHGKYLNIHRKQADGSWKCQRSIWNSDLRLSAPEKPAAPAKKKK